VEFEVVVAKGRQEQRIGKVLLDQSREIVMNLLQILIDLCLERFV